MGQTDRGSAVNGLDWFRWHGCAEHAFQCPYATAWHQGMQPYTDVCVYYDTPFTKDPEEHNFSIALGVDPTPSYFALELGEPMSDAFLGTGTAEKSGEQLQDEQCSGQGPSALDDAEHLSAKTEDLISENEDDSACTQDNKQSPGYPKRDVQRAPRTTSTKRLGTPRPAISGTRKHILHQEGLPLDTTVAKQCSLLGGGKREREREQITQACY